MQSTSYLASWIVWLPLLGFFFNAFSGFLIPDRAAQKRAVAIVAPLAVLLAFVVALYVLFAQVMQAPDHRILAPMLPGDGIWIGFGDTIGFTVKYGLLLDPLSMLMALIVTGVGGLIHVYATGYMADDREFPRFFTYFNLFIFMMLLLVMGENFLLMFVGWEGVGSCSYLLISFWYTDVNNAKAGNKAFIVNRVGDLGFALGIMAVWSVFGTLSFFQPGEHGHGVMQLAHAGAMNVSTGLSAALDVQNHPVPTAMIVMICGLLFVGAVGKSAQIPLFVWLPDAMAGPTPVSALIHAATMVTAGVVMVTRCSWLFVQAGPVLQWVGIIGLVTAFIGATIGLVQTDIKRVLAYSTVSQLGYMFLACGVGNFTAGMFHVTTHAFFKALLFLGSGAVIHSMHGEQDMRKMGGLRKLIPRTWMLMFIGTYAIAGFPLLSGFWSKDEILEAASRSFAGNGLILYGVGLLTAFMTAYYMNRLMWMTFYTEPRFVDGELEEHHHSNFDDEEETHGAHDTHNPHGEQTGHEEATTGQDAHGGHGQGHGTVHESPNSMLIPLYILALFSIGFGLLAGPLFGNGFRHFLEPSVAPMELGDLKEAAPLSFLSGPYAGYIISSVIAIAGLGLAYMRFKSGLPASELAPEDQKMRNPIYRILAEKWYFDWFYNLVFIRIGGWFADRILWRTIDKGLIDGAVNTLAGAVGVFSRAGRRMQTGLVRNYALIMLAGVVALALALLSKAIALQ
jgi:NADH-quinone oxidoreductase subunit L